MKKKLAHIGLVSVGDTIVSSAVFHELQRSHGAEILVMNNEAKLTDSDYDQFLKERVKTQVVIKPIPELIETYDFIPQHKKKKPNSGFRLGSYNSKSKRS